MSNDNNTAKYYDLHTKGAGFLNRFREVKPKPNSGQKFKPFCSVSIGAFRGDSENIEYTNFDTVITGTKALEIIKQYQKEINDQNTKVIVGFTIGDTYGYTYVIKNKDTQQDEHRCGIKGRFLSIQFLKINGEMVYKYEKPESEKETEAQAENKNGTPTKEVQAPEAGECPFDEQLGNTVILSTNDPLFDEKVRWLGNNGYTFNHRDNTWLLNQK